MGWVHQGEKISEGDEGVRVGTVTMEVDAERKMGQVGEPNGWVTSGRIGLGEDLQMSVEF